MLVTTIPLDAEAHMHPEQQGRRACRGFISTQTSSIVAAMYMRIPDSGGLGSLLSGLGSTPIDGHDRAIESVTTAQLIEAIAAMERGDIEYVILENGDEFLQAAGGGEGPYALQFSPLSGAAMEEARGGVDALTVRTVFLAYHRSDPTWRGGCAWSAM
jgi:hypothetical protein